MFVLRVILCTVLAGTGIAHGDSGQLGLTPEARDAVAAYLRDPGGNAKTFLDAAREQGGEVSPLQALLLGDAAIRAGRYRTASEFFMAVQDGGLASAADFGMAWAALGRGQLGDAYEHLEAAGTRDPSLRPMTDFAMAMVAAANGSSDGPSALRAAEAQNGIDPALREVAPLLDAYARYWSGDAAGAAAAFTAFAVANPDGRFTDDALYAAAQAKLRAGRDDEAEADLEALAGDQPPKGRLSSPLIALDGRALLREGMRRDRGRPTRLFPRRLADLLDGDGVRLAQAALAARGAHEATDAASGEIPAGAGVSHVSRNGAPDAGNPSTPPSGVPAPAPGNVPAPAQPGATPARAAQFPWTAVFAIAGLLLLLALWWLARGRSDQARSR
jgi:tetratricopeptide (TPR) repeat protein